MLALVLSPHCLGLNNNGHLEVPTNGLSGRLPRNMPVFHVWCMLNSEESRKESIAVE